MGLSLSFAHLPFSPVCLLVKNRSQIRNLKLGISTAARNFWLQHSYQEYVSPIFTQPSIIISVFKERVGGYEQISTTLKEYREEETEGTIQG